MFENVNHRYLCEALKKGLNLLPHCMQSLRNDEGEDCVSYFVEEFVPFWNLFATPQRREVVSMKHR